MTARSRIFPVVTAFLLTGIATLAPVSAAVAHDPVTVSTPSEGEVLSSPPAQFSVTAAKPMLDVSGDSAGFGLQVTDASGLYFGDGCLTIAGDTLSMPATLGASGDYTLTYQYVSSDGHTLSDSIAFRFAPTGAATVQAGLTDPPTCGQTAAEPPTSTAPAREQTDESFAVLVVVAVILGGIVVLGAVIALIARRNRATVAGNLE